MILVTGGAGYIGSHLNKMLNKEKIDTLVLDNLSRGHEDLVKWGHFIRADLADKNMLIKIMNNYKIEGVMHFAAYACVGESVESPALYYRNNYVNTLNLLDAMAESGVNNIVFSSTCATYGEPIEIPITEDHPQNPVNPYGRAKLMVEQTLRDYDRAYGIKSVCLRYFNAAGCDPDKETGERHDPETHLIPLVLAAAAQRLEKVTIFGNDYPTPDGTCIRDYIHVNDLARAHILSLDFLNEKKESICLNLGNNKGFSVREIIEKARHVTGRNIISTDSKRRPGDPARLVGSAQKARDILAWKPEFDDLETIIRTAWEWHKKEWNV
jgi:UDP-glucose 4-epimerase